MWKINKNKYVYIFYQWSETWFGAFTDERADVLHIHLRVENEVTWDIVRECKQQGQFDYGMLSYWL